jgi:hypothetical protein
LSIEPVEAPPEDGDVYAFGSGEHIGTVDVSGFDLVKTALHLQIQHRSRWYVYQLVGIEEMGEQDVTAPRKD